MKDKAMHKGVSVIVMDRRDHVATALRELVPGETITCEVQGNSVALVVNQPIPFGHKVAVVQITEGEHVLKYGEVIGRAVCGIPIGDHVHVHNIEGIRGRGDQAAGAPSAAEA
ncbi:UxaA family hydrolase [Paenibacillus apiarius]|uniref:UxaA family hydrolase n=1 Tax=Paenibacillus apiarius TaxID=46240 RepID=A0ABT4DMZ5_9BACL|nr:UxaA family hydrolase [Paenibacillus apiarius]MCY9514742.1 UxaA family hydrolase [Paenibacillus apiarius]MCY9518732.1 UxaA family hydrolase [Paenibacillus apiarius]MCY9552827.1 UxaA family hydrolase [Paenibacillus apiarius]MCY9556852.1 UxaA family hydrolase [Paenibacillus apiarius]MCY9686195.1 UxaA family hydrolase [Paenibacillus apiarius]